MIQDVFEGTIDDSFYNGNRISDVCSNIESLIREGIVADDLTVIGYKDSEEIQKYYDEKYGGMEWNTVCELNPVSVLPKNTRWLHSVLNTNPLHRFVRKDPRNVIVVVPLLMKLLQSTGISSGRGQLELIRAYITAARLQPDMSQS